MMARIAHVGAALTAMALAAAQAFGQDGRTPGLNRSDAEGQVIAAQEAFWAAFNACDLDGMARGFTEDVEFYHDQEGMSATREKVAASMLAGPCEPSSDRQVRREPIAETDEVYLLAGNYALTSGKHRFLTRRCGGIERHDSIARYTATWQRTAAGWQMHRVVSYDHLPDLPQLMSVGATAQQLGKLEGTYLLDDGTALPAKVIDGKLTLGEGERAFTLVPLGDDRFGVQGLWLQFRFDRGRIEVFDEGELVASGAAQ